MRPHQGWRQPAETPSEHRIRRALEDAGLPFEQESRVGPYTVDFRIGDRVIVEVDGFFHCTKAAAESDSVRDRHLQDLGYIVYRVTNDETKSDRRLQRLIAQIRSELKAQAPVRDGDSLLARPFDRPALRELLEKLEAGQIREAQAEADRLPARRKKRRLTDRELFEKWINEMHDRPDDRE